MSGKQIRLRRIFRENGRTVISALDFGGFMGPVPGLEQPKAIVEKVVAGGADAIIANPGFAEETSDVYGGRAGLILRITGGCSRYSPDPTFHTMISSVEEAVRLGADAVCVMVIVGSAQEHAMMANLGAVAKKAAEYQIPLVAELLPDFEYQFEPEWIGVCARVGFELGADVIKTYYCGEGYADVVKNCPIPIVMAGGPKNTDLLTNLSGALQAGAAGAAIGRNIFQAEDATAMTQRVVALVHGA